MTHPNIKTLRRFFSKIAVADSGCWIWCGSKSDAHYGVFGVGGVNTSAHRYAYSWFVGVIPAGYDVDHLCRVPPCVNPAHLEAVTKRENQARAIRPTRVVCKRGHLLTDLFPQTNYGKTFLTCRLCRELRETRRRTKRRLAALIAAIAEQTPGATVRTVIELERKVSA